VVGERLHLFDKNQYLSFKLNISQDEGFSWRVDVSDRIAGSDCQLLLIGCNYKSGQRFVTAKPLNPSCDE
jgi:hypothetical protein